MLQKRKNMQIALIIFLLLIVSGVLYEQYARYRAKSYKIAGDFVDVGGHKLHYLKKGEGKATIIFESGADFGGHIIWRNIQEKLSKNFTTLSYDRAGILHSQRGDNPKTCANMAKELHIMIEELALPKPYIFVGHSLAGLTLRCFVDKYPENVVGAVLLDPTHPDIFDDFPAKTKKRYATPPPKWIISPLLRLGILRIALIKLLEKGAPNALKSEKENYKEAVDLIHKGSDAYIEEFSKLLELLAETKGLEFRKIPVVVLGATKPTFDTPKIRDSVKVMTENHIHKTVKLSSNGKYIAVDCPHTIQFEMPDFVVEAVEDFAKEVL